MKKETIISKNFIFGWLALFCVSSIMYMLNTTITEYATAFGATAMVAGMVSGIYTIGGLISRLYGGSAMNKHGWKRITLIFSALSVLACGLYFIVSDVTMLLVVRFLHGLAFGSCASGIITITSSTLPDSRHGEGMGFMMLATTVATGVGPYVGSMVIDATGANGGFVMAMALSACIFLFIALTNVPLDPGRNIETRAKLAAEAASRNAQKATGIRRFFEPAAIPISICCLLFALSYSGVAAFVRLYSAEFELQWIVAYFFLIQCGILLFSQPLFGKIQDITRSDNTVMIIGISAQVVGVFLMFIYPHWITLVIGAIGTAMGYQTLKSVAQAIATRGVSEERRSYAVSTFWIFTDIGMGIGPAFLGVFAGLSIGYGGYSTVFLASSAIMLIALPAYWFLWGRSKGKKQMEEPAFSEEMDTKAI